MACIGRKAWGQKGENDAKGSREVKERSAEPANDSTSADETEECATVAKCAEGYEVHVGGPKTIEQ